MSLQGFRRIVPSRHMRAVLLTIARLFAPVVVSACDVAGVSGPNDPVLDSCTSPFRRWPPASVTCQEMANY